MSASEFYDGIKGVGEARVVFSNGDVLNGKPSRVEGFDCEMFRPTAEGAQELMARFTARTYRELLRLASSAQADFRGAVVEYV